MDSVEIEEIVSVPVPVGALPLVHQALNRYYDAQSKPSPETITVPGSGEWSREQVAHLHGLIKNPALLSIVRRVAEKAGEPVSYGLLADAAGISFSQLRAQLAWLSKYGVKVKGTRAWPMTVKENSKAPKGERYQYTMLPPMAAWWLEIDDEARRH